MRQALPWISCALLVGVALGTSAGDLPIPGKIYNAKRTEEFSKARFAEELGNWIKRYNTDYPHQSLKNMTPKQYYENFNKEPVLT